MIRVMQETDIPQLAQLFLKGRRQTFHWVDPAHFRLEDFDEQTRGEQIWVAEQGGAPCGFVSIWRIIDDPYRVASIAMPPGASPHR